MPLTQTAFPIPDSDDLALPIAKLERQLLAAAVSERTQHVTEVFLRDSLGYIQSILDTLSTPMLILDATLNVKTASRGFYQTFNISPDTAENCFLYDLENGAWDIPALRESLEEVLPMQNSFENFELTHEFPNLGQRTMLLSGRKLWRTGSHTTMILLVIEDITVRKKIAEELLRSNEDLQRFAYVAAHDLRTPLGAALGLSNILSSRIRSRLDERENEILTMAIDSMKSLGTMMDGILSYSVAQSSQPVYKMLPLEEPLQMALANLRSEIMQSGAVIRHSNLPTLCADRTPLVLLFQNLIGNAIKYRRPDVAPVITISTRQTDTDWVISIADNGRGFAPDEAQKIFEPFTRLKTTGTSGSGIGLATCKRIVTSLKGTIWAESPNENEAVFNFTIPVKTITGT